MRQTTTAFTTERMSVIRFLSDANCEKAILKMRGENNESRSWFREGKIGEAKGQKQGPGWPARWPGPKEEQRDLER